jgi:hypothetical protein
MSYSPMTINASNWITKTMYDSLFYLFCFILILCSISAYNDSKIGKKTNRKIKGVMTKWKKRYL